MSTQQLERLPVGFRFKWDGDCPGQRADEWIVRPYLGGVPLFSVCGIVSDVRQDVWSDRLEAVAREEWAKPAHCIMCGGPPDRLDHTQSCERCTDRD